MQNAEKNIPDLPKSLNPNEGSSLKGSLKGFLKGSFKGLFKGLYPKL